MKCSSQNFTTFLLINVSYVGCLCLQHYCKLSICHNSYLQIMHLKFMIIVIPKTSNNCFNSIYTKLWISLDDILAPFSWISSKRPRLILRMSKDRSSKRESSFVNFSRDQYRLIEYRKFHSIFLHCKHLHRNCRLLLVYVMYMHGLAEWQPLADASSFYPVLK